MATILFTYVLVVKLNICHFNKKGGIYKKQSNYPVILSNLSINIFLTHQMVLFIGTPNKKSSEMFISAIISQTAV